MNKADNLPMSAEEASKEYAIKSFIWPINKSGEKQSIPIGQKVPKGYAKHTKEASKHFLVGAKWHEENVLSHHINVLAERIAEKAKTVCGYGDCDMPYCDMQCQAVDSNSIREIAKDYINELNLQSSK